MSSRALDGVDVIDLGQVYHGPYASLMLAYLGANVIKVEPPFGEQLRDRVEPGEEPAELVMMNSSKQGITLDLSKDGGKEVFLDLVADSDVVIENFSTGTMEALDFGYERLNRVNPKLIYAHGSGFGERGPYKEYPAMDLTVQAMSGVTSVTGFEDQPPVKAGIAVADFMGGIHLAAGVLAALYQREFTGEGQYVEESMHDAVYPTLSSAVAAYYNESDAPQRTGNRHSGLNRAPYNVYEAMDGYVAIFCSTNDHWQQLLDVIGGSDLADEPRF
jgi:crotonobetainyl-CoA:carnitine CoA-transferase CaiB-like acyl-CoA transferase